MLLPPESRGLPLRSPVRLASPSGFGAPVRGYASSRRLSLKALHHLPGKASLAALQSGKPPVVRNYAGIKQANIQTPPCPDRAPARGYDSSCRLSLQNFSLACPVRQALPQRQSGKPPAVRNPALNE